MLLPKALDKALDKAVEVPPSGYAPGEVWSTGSRGGAASVTNLLEVAADFVVVLQLLAVFLGQMEFARGVEQLRQKRP